MKMIMFLILIATANIIAQFSGGSGSSVDPYWLTTRNNVDSIRYFLDSSFVVKNDISFGDTLIQPIGNHNTPFTGSLNGQGFSFTNLNVGYYSYGSGGEDTGYVALFGCISNSKVEDIYVRNIKDYYSDTYAEQFYQGFIGAAINNSEVYNVRILDNSTFDGGNNVSSVSVTSKGYIGMLLGYNGGTVSQCSQILSNLNIIYNSNNGFNDIPAELYLGSMIGYTDGLVENSGGSVNSSIQFMAKTTNANGTIYYFGGFIGGIGNSGSVWNCYVKNELLFYQTTHAESIPGVWSKIGGFVGYNGGQIYYSYSVPEIRSYENNGQTNYGYFSGTADGSYDGAISTDDFYTGIFSSYKGNYATPVTIVDTVQLRGNTSWWTSFSYNFVNVWSKSTNFNYGYPFGQNNLIEITTPVPTQPVLNKPNNGLIYVDVNTYFSWIESFYSNYYRLNIYKSPSMQLIQTKTLSLEFSWIYNLEYNTQYAWEVIAYNSEGSSSSDLWTFTTTPDPNVDFGKAVLLNPQSDTTGLVTPYTMRWNQVYGATEHKLQIYDLTGTVIDSTTTSDTVYIFNTTLKSETLRWRVRGEKNISSQIGEWSDYWFFTLTEAVPDTVIRINPVNNGDIKSESAASWYKSNGALEYEIQFIDTSLVDSLFYTPTITDTFVIVGDGNFEIGKTYKWRMRAINNTYQSSWNARQYFTVIAPEVPSLPDLPDMPVGICDSAITGSGTFVDPYMIYNATQMNQIDSIGLTKHYKLGCHIDYALEGVVNHSIGQRSGVSFKGSFDGNNYEIRNWEFHDATTEPFAGFFFYLDGTTVLTNDSNIVKNVTFRNCYLHKYRMAGSSNQYVGLLSSYANRYNVYDITAIKCTVIVEDTVDNAGYIPHLGGILGTGNENTGWLRADSCYLKQFGTSPNRITVGGLVGVLSGDISDSYITNSTITSIREGLRGEAGGLVYRADRIGNCYAINNIFIVGSPSQGFASGLSVVGMTSLTRSYTAMNSVSDTFGVVNPVNNYFTVVSTTTSNWGGSYVDTTGGNSDFTLSATGGNAKNTTEMHDSTTYVDRIYGTWFDLQPPQDDSSWIAPQPGVNYGYPTLDWSIIKPGSPKPENPNPGAYLDVHGIKQQVFKID